MTHPDRPSENGSGPRPATARLADASFHASRPVTFAVLIVILTLMPALFLADLPSRPFLVPMALSFGLTVAVSLLVAMTVAPALATLLLVPRDARSGDLGHLAHPGGAERAREPAPARHRAWGAGLRRRLPRPTIGRRLGRAYEWAVGRLIRRPRWAALIAVVLLMVGAASLTQLNASLRPSFQENSATVLWTGPPGTSLDEMARVMGRAAAELRTVKGVRDVGAHVGRAVSADQVVGASSGELWLNLDPKGDHDATMAAVTTVVDGYPGFDHRVFSYFNDRVSAVAGTPPEPVVVRLYGEDYDVLRAKADEIRRLLLGVPGVVAPRVEQQPMEPAIDVLVNLDAAQRNGIKPGDIRRAATTLVAGIEVGSLYQDQKVFKVVVRGTPDVSRNLTLLQDLTIDTPTGGHVRLGDVAQVTIAPGPSVIKHEAVSRSLDVTAGVHGRSVDAVLKDVRHRVQGVSFPLGHDAKVLGDFQTRSAAERRVGLIGLGVLAFVLLLLQAATRRWRLALLALAVLPLAVAGGAAAAWADGAAVSLGSLAGLFAAGAVAMVSSLMLLDRMGRLQARYRETFGPALVVRAARECGPAMAGAAVVTAAVLLPFVALGNVPGTELVRPMGLVMLGGLLSSLVTTALVVPALYLPFSGLARPTEMEPVPDHLELPELPEEVPDAR